MNSEIYINISNSPAHKSSRENKSQPILINTDLFPDLLEQALNVGDENHHKACRILALVLGKQLHLVTDHLPVFCLSLSRFTNKSALRSISGISLSVSQHLTLSTLQEQQIIESSFDWLISENQKVATKTYSIRTLFELGKKHDWIRPALQGILIEDYHRHSAAYKVTARQILKKIK
jgi:hypothetical protein